jgi:hypothetical protein
MALKTISAQKPPEKSITDIYEEASASVAAETLLKALAPKLDQALLMRMQELFNAPPELGAILDCRAQIKAVWEMREGLKREIKRGSKSVEIMQNLLIKSA